MAENENGIIYISWGKYLFLVFTIPVIILIFLFFLISDPGIKGLTSALLASIFTVILFYALFAD